MSLPSRERGLKFMLLGGASDAKASLPSRERGLKSLLDEITLLHVAVAPLAGAWIEMIAYSK